MKSQITNRQKSELICFTPTVQEPGGGYTKPPSVEVIETSSFDSVYSSEITTLDLYRQNQYNNVAYDPMGTFITRPSAKTLLTDTVVNKVVVRPIKVDIVTGRPLHFGGRGMNRDNPPPTTILRSSYWEDYNGVNATAISYIDGVGSINHSNSGGSGYPGVPDMVIFGAGMEANYSVSIRAKDNKKDPSWKKSNILEKPVLVDQGIEYDPHSTVAVALYPIEPFAYWSFDQNESLFENNAAQYLKSTSGFNLPIEDGLVAYWKMDEVNETTLTTGAFTIEDNSSSNNDINVNAGGGGANVARTYWGTKNRSINFDPTDSIAVTNANITDSGTNGTFTFSFWTQSFNAVHALEIHLGDINLSISGNSLSLRHPSSPGFLGTSPTLNMTGRWNNIVCRYDGTQDKVELFVNGENKINTTINNPGVGNALNFPIGNSGVLLDEMMVYNRALTDAEIGHLAGNVFLDLSGNKYNAVALGTGFEMNSTTDAGSVNNSFSTDLGEAVSFDGNNSSRYLDLTTHIKSFSGLEKGTIAFWIKPNSLANDMTVLSGSCTDDNQSFFRILLRDNGKIRTEVYNDETEFCKLSSGGSTTIGPSNWSHVAVVIGENGISYFINGKSVPVVVPPDSSNARAFFVDVDKLNFLAIGKHQTKEANATNYFNGQLDELHIFERVLTGGEIQYLYNVGKEQGVQRAILSPQVDAIGTVTVTNVGAGYKGSPRS